MLSRKPPNTRFALLAVDNQGVPGACSSFFPMEGPAAGSPTFLPSAYIDFGMRNLAHRPSDEDIGRDGTAPDLPPFQNPLDGNNLSPLLRGAGEAEEGGQTTPRCGGLRACHFGCVNPYSDPQLPVNDRSVTKGAFKVPNLRIAKWTGPYFHDGGYSTLRQVVQFYARGGNFPATNFNEMAFGIVPLAHSISLRHR